MKLFDEECHPILPGLYTCEVNKHRIMELSHFHIFRGYWNLQMLLRSFLFCPWARHLR